MICPKCGYRLARLVGACEFIDPETGQRETRQMATIVCWPCGGITVRLEPALTEDGIGPDRLVPVAKGSE